MWTSLSATHTYFTFVIAFANVLHRLRAVSFLTDSSHLFNKAGLTEPFSFTCSDYLNASVALVALIRAANLILVIVHTLPRHSFQSHDPPSVDRLIALYAYWLMYCHSLHCLYLLREEFNNTHNKNNNTYLHYGEFACDSKMNRLSSMMNQ